MGREKFLAQSYMDAWQNYEYSLSDKRAACWDYVVVTASNPRQAEVYKTQIKKRQKENSLPKETIFLVISDIDGVRIGSGGATLNVLRVLSERIGAKGLLEQKILLCHSGGDSKRIPQYSACGKLFAPVPRMLPNGRKSSLFDELLISVSGIPARVPAGILIMPGDTEILFNTMQIDLSGCEAAGLSVKTSVSEGKEHGVFIADSSGNVLRFLHKQREEVLKRAGAEDQSGCVDIDTGCIWLGKRVIEKLYNLCCDENGFSEKQFLRYANPKVCLNFYADFVYPLASHSTLQEYYEEVPEGILTEDLRRCRKEIWNTLHEFSLKLIRMVPADYIHFGTTWELFHLMTQKIETYRFLEWNRQTFSVCTAGVGAALYNSSVDASVELPASVYLEDSIIEGQSRVGKNVILSGVEVKDTAIPDDTVLHCLKLVDGSCVCRIYGIHDNPKATADSPFLGSTLSRVMERTNLMWKDVWSEPPASIWNAAVHCVCPEMEEAVRMALLLKKIASGTAEREEIERWKTCRKISLKDSFNQADIGQILAWQTDVSRRISRKQFLEGMRKGVEVKKLLPLLEPHSQEEMDFLAQMVCENPFPVNMRFSYALSELCRSNNLRVQGKDWQDYENQAYEIIKKAILPSVARRHPFDRAKGYFRKESFTVELPVRVNFCGSPSDAAPYCLENGGTMLDGALLLNGRKPIRATVKRLTEPVIELESRDLAARERFTEKEKICECSDPTDLFALHKAVLLATGVVGDTETIEEICGRIGGGICLYTDVDVPKGSGLGTSSLVAAACVRALNEILGQDRSDETVYAQVFAAEQIMNTGGGWQDQCGGLVPGIKLMKSFPGTYQSITIDRLRLTETVWEELNQRFCLIFSGQRRLARNVLRKEMNQCMGNNPQSLELIERIRQICVLMAYELERGNIKGFAKYITEQYEMVKRLDSSTSNTCIEYIFEACGDLIDGRSICGAGGGGFLQVILKKGIAKEDLNRRIREVFHNCGVSVWSCTLI